MLEHITKAARLGGAQIVPYYGKAVQSLTKSTIADLRTEADVASETAILTELRSHYPDFNYLAEESGETKTGSEYTFIIDPLDGTNNFSLGIPHFSVSIALMKGTEILLGVVYNPLTLALYAAEKGNGAYENETPLHTSSVTDIHEATISYTAGYTIPTHTHEKLQVSLNKRGVKRSLALWSPALDYCMLAGGRIESVICNGNDVYDNAAGKIIVREAGGVITDHSGNDERDQASTYFIASNNPTLHQKVMDAYTEVSR